MNDTQRALWGALGISSWPTQVVVSPAGKVLFSVAGEGHAQDIEDCVAAALEYYGELGTLRNDPLPLVRHSIRCYTHPHKQAEQGVLFSARQLSERVGSKTSGGCRCWRRTSRARRETQR